MTTVENKFMTLTQPTTKTCLKCKIEKDKNEYDIDPNKHDGLKGWCKSCIEQVKSENTQLKGSLQDKVMTIDEVRTEERRLQSIRAKLEAEQVQKGREIKIVKDFDSLTPEERLSHKSYYEIIDKRDMNDPKLRKAPYEFNGAQVSTLFGKQNSIRKGFEENKFGSIYDFDNRQITFLYFEKSE